jgi:actin-related protein
VLLDASHPPREGLEVCSPAVLDGLVQDWDALERLWERAIARNLKVDLHETPVLMAEKPYHSPKSRQRCSDELNAFVSI